EAESRAVPVVWAGAAIGGRGERVGAGRHPRAQPKVRASWNRDQRRRRRLHPAHREHRPSADSPFDARRVARSAQRAAGLERPDYHGVRRSRWTGAPRIPRDRHPDQRPGPAGVRGSGPGEASGHGPSRGHGVRSTWALRERNHDGDRRRGHRADPARRRRACPSQAADAHPLGSPTQRSRVLEV
ncbi:MAG: hypothetical protein AVDCRST_MAG67-4229, partial [uncultured Solirubrobacteraceae bacterium]